jgi:hypothetical protein
MSASTARPGSTRKTEPWALSPQPFNVNPSGPTSEGNDAMSEGIAITHTAAEGTLVFGTARGDGSKDILGPAGFRWMRSRSGTTARPGTAVRSTVRKACWLALWQPRPTPPTTHAEPRQLPGRSPTVAALPL